MIYSITPNLINFNSPPPWVVLLTLLVLLGFAIRGYRRAARKDQEQ